MTETSDKNGVKDRFVAESFHFTWPWEDKAQEED